MAKLSALMIKNFILMKRSWCLSLVEILLPMLLMLVVVWIRSLMEIEENFPPTNFEEFAKKYSILSNSTKEPTKFYDIPPNTPFKSCLGPKNQRKAIGIFEPNDLTENVYKRLEGIFTKKSFASEELLQEYSGSSDFGANQANPELCFGFGLKKNSATSYTYTVKFFGPEVDRDNIVDIPSTTFDAQDKFTVFPNMDAYTKWQDSGYINVMKLIGDEILRDSTGLKTAEINFAILPKKFKEDRKDDFGGIVGALLPLFYMICAIIPLARYVNAMVTDKELRIKEGMKIMGLDETTYFLSYFFHVLIIIVIYSIFMSLILMKAFSHVNYVIFFLINFFFFLSVFGLIYFFQSFIDSARVATILAIIIYFVFFFISTLFNGDNISNGVKMLISVFPPCAFTFGIETVGKFESSFKTLDFKTIGDYHWNYSVSNMIFMLFIDTLIYLVIGFYLQNTVSSEYGQTQPWYFIFSPSYWKGDVAPVSNNGNKTENQSLVNDPEAFQDESHYQDKLKSGECLEVKNLVKEFGDGKIAVNGLSVNMYENEIFALLGHNGAGKSTTISILSGLYNATAGTALYNNFNVLTNMNEFRKSLGICPQHDVLFLNMTVREHLSLFCEFKGVPSDKKEEEIRKTIDDLEMNEIENRFAKALSGGQKRKLSIAIALIGGSKVVFLDEPTSGMDITSRRKLWDILKNCVDNRIVILTTHYMEEAAILGNRIGIMSGGKLNCCGNALFLISKFGKFVSITVSKNEGAIDDEIIQFFERRIPNIESEPLREEVLFRVPKTSDLSLQKFFQELDENKDKLKIKNYGASMPTLEDVFLNTSDDKSHQKKVEGAESGYNRPQLKSQLETSFCTHLYQSLRKRSLQIFREKKILVLEMLGPIVLTICGAVATKVSFLNDPPYRLTNIDLIEGTKYVPFSDKIFIPTTSTVESFFTNKENVNYDKITVNQGITPLVSIENFLDAFSFKMFGEDNDIPSFGGYYLLKVDDVKKQYDAVIASDLLAQDAPIIFFDHLLKIILNRAAAKTFDISFNNNPFPLEFDLGSRVDSGANSRFAFFVGIGFAVIASNIVGSLVREKSNNSKQLQIISGMSHYGYWISNYIFEFIKYYVYAIIAIIIGYAITDLEDLWIFFVLFGVAMIPYFYAISFYFDDEGGASNLVLIFCFVGGAIGGNIFVTLRLFESTMNIAKRISWILRFILPNFSFSMGLNTVSSIESIWFAEEGKGFMALDLNKFNVAYAGADILLLIVWAILGPILVICLQFCTNRIGSKSVGSDPSQGEVTDEGVLEDIRRSKGNASSFSVQLNNVEKIFGGSCCNSEKKVAIDKLNLCLEPGECFAFLGINGAGKSTTFKTLTLDVIPTSGMVNILGKELSANFNELRKHIGYCPQNDSFFHYMTVRENLDFFSAVKGLSKEDAENSIQVLMGAMNIHQYEHKISGQLSGGNKRKLSVAIALIGEPDIILLDEPSAGMDPEARRFMWHIINKVTTGEKKSTVILTTHSMEEAETLCRRVGILVKGQFKTLGSFQNVKATYGEGFEIDMTLNIIDEKTENIIMERLNLNKSMTLSVDEFRAVIEQSSYKAFSKHLVQGGMGSELLVEFKIRNKLPVERLIRWIYLTSNAWNCFSELLSDFPNISIIEYYGSNFKAKIYREGTESKSIGYLFGKFEEMVSF